jgi:hypothetical protein
MRTNPIPARRKHPKSVIAFALQASFIFLLGSVAVVTVVATPHSDEGQTLLVRVEAPESDVLKAVEQVTQDQIIHGTYSYEKERILYGAHSADAARVFGVWKGQGKAFYKVANKVLSPRFFKDSEDIGTISVRYVVQEAGPDAASVQIDAIFVDARNVRHPSLGNVESSEYAAVQQHLKTIQEARRATQEATATYGPKQAVSALQPAATSTPADASSDSSASSLSLPELQKQIETLRHQVELRVKDPGAPLKSAPFRSSTTLESLPGATEVLVEILTPYWYGVETEDGHHGWIHHSQLEPLP